MKKKQTSLLKIQRLPLLVLITMVFLLNPSSRKNAYALPNNYTAKMNHHTQKMEKEAVEKQLGRKLKWKERWIIKILNKKIRKVKKKQRRGGSDIKQPLRLFLGIILFVALIMFGGVIWINLFFHRRDGKALALWPFAGFVITLGLFIWLILDGIKQKERLEK